MIHLKEFDDQGLEGLVDDLESLGYDKPKGYLLYVYESNSAYTKERTENSKGHEMFRYFYYVVSAPSLESAMKIFRDNGVSGSKYYDWEEKGDKIKTFDDFATSWVTSYSMTKKEFPIDVQWIEGLEPKSGKSFFAKIDSENPYTVIDFLDEHFSNAKEKFDEYLTSNQVRKMKVM